MDRDKNIDPLQDIDFEALGLMTPKSAQGNGDPETPPAPKKEQPKSDPAPAEDPDPDDDDPQDPADPADPAPADDPDDPEGDDPDGDDPADDPDDPDGDDPDDPADPDDPDDPQDPPRTVVSELIELMGYEDLNAEDFSDTVEGIGKLVETSAQKLAEQRLEQTFQAYPDVQEFFEFVASGGDPDQYHEVRGKVIDYGNMEVQEDNEAQQERLVRQALSGDSYEADEIDTMVEKYKAGGILKDQAELALKGLKRQHQRQKAELTERQKQLQIEQQENVTQFWNEVETTLKDKDTFKGITIPKNERQKVFDYISKPVKDGYSQRDLDAMKLGLEEKIAIDYLIMKGFPLGDLVDKKAASKAASDLRKRIKSGGDPKPRKANPPKPAGRSGQPSIADLDLINL